jgi:CheY-like chemotaxis protein
MARTVLIVEDDRDIRLALAQFLGDEGFSTAQARNGREALEVLRSSPPPALILLDLMMPILDGWQFRAAQRADPALAAIPVLVITADSSAERDPSMQGIAGFLKKPLNVDELLEKVRCFSR